MTGQPSFRPATCQDAEAVVALVNRAYRPEPGQGGWTHESEWIVQPRLNTAQFNALLQDPVNSLLVAEQAQQGTPAQASRTIIGCVLMSHVMSSNTISSEAVLSNEALSNEALSNEALSNEALSHEVPGHKASNVHIGLLTVDPACQAQQVGRQLLAYAEHLGQTLFQPACFEMSVVHTRHELIAYYERRGYQQTGQLKPYPADQNVGTPKVPLHLIIMRKQA